MLLVEKITRRPGRWIAIGRKRLMWMKDRRRRRMLDRVRSGLEVLHLRREESFQTEKAIALTMLKMGKDEGHG